ncbi:hypothetical protein SBA2_1250004 [Acidobacteriia bacterium SbA2]|nr:hypothetical protein SBA2_1250004 [Acidobacteriia bacterium SbA2]
MVIQACPSCARLPGDDYVISLIAILAEKRQASTGPKNRPKTGIYAQNRAKSLFRNILKISPLRSRFWRGDAP